MCGIAGIFTRTPVQDRDLLLAMRETMLHRGPDAAGVWWSEDGRLGLAHRRLAIIDLSPRGYQPMQDASGRYVVVFNGEIYNFQELRARLARDGHSFRSTSDTEVLLEAYRKWGVDCLDHLCGAFAFALFDREEKVLFLARDRAGEKPLFYRQWQGGFAFASELKALMADPGCERTLDLDALNLYLAYGYVPGDRTMIRAARKLLPGHAMLHSQETGSTRIWRYWELPQGVTDSAAGDGELCEELETVLTAAVKRQLVADVPVGVLLSGGLDSSLITALAAGVCDRKVKTFTVSFPGHGSLDEGPYARLVADHFGTEHTELVAEPASVELLPQLARQYDEPIADHSIVPTSMLAGLVRSSVTVALGGDGGDELFGGYPHYNFLQRMAPLRRRIPSPLRGMASLAASHLMPVGTRGRNHLIGLAGGAGRSLSAVDLFFDDAFRARLTAPLYRGGFRPTASPEGMKEAFFDPRTSLFQNATRADFRTTMVDDYLVKSDRASMLHSLELRAPFLDRALIEFAFGRVPDRLRASGTERKVLLRLLGKKLLPPALDINRKQGFTLPIEAWFKGAWGEFMTGVLTDADPAIFDRKRVADVLQGQHRGRANGSRLFALTMFELWRREYRVTI